MLGCRDDGTYFVVCRAVVVKLYMCICVCGECSTVMLLVVSWCKKECRIDGTYFVVCRVVVVKLCVECVCVKSVILLVAVRWYVGFPIAELTDFLIVVVVKWVFFW